MKLVKEKLVKMSVESFKLLKNFERSPLRIPKNNQIEEIES